MLQRTDEDQRRDFFYRHVRGESYSEIAFQSGFSKECVRYWCRRQSRGGGVKSHYVRQPAGLLGRFHPLVRYVILKLRLEHPGWGPTPLRLGLQKRASLAPYALPSRAQIGRYLHQFERLRRKKRPKAVIQRPHQPQTVFQRWQIDFKLGIPLKDGTQVNLHTVCDPVAEACIGAIVFPAGQVGQAPKKVVQEQVRQVLRGCFAGWGTLPAELQTDGESTLVANRGPNDFPTSLTLWLEGLGIHHLVIRPGRPTDNAEVERMHRTVNNFALKGTRLTDLHQINAALAESLRLLTYELPSQAHDCHGRPPIQAHPELTHPTLRFQPEWELACFDLQRVDHFLACRHWERRVSKTGQVELGGQVYSAGRPHARQLVTIHFDPQARELVFAGRNPDTGLWDLQCSRHPIRGCEVADLLGYTLPALAPGPQQLPLPLVWSNTQIGVSC